MTAQFKGAEVFRNVGCDGSVDVVLKIGEELVQIDVKTCQWCRGGSGHYSWTSPNAASVEHPVYPVLVEPDGPISNWRIRWKNQKNSRYSGPLCPEGLETFWDNPSTQV